MLENFIKFENHKIKKKKNLKFNFFNKFENFIFFLDSQFS